MTVWNKRESLARVKAEPLQKKRFLKMGSPYCLATLERAGGGGGGSTQRGKFKSGDVKRRPYETTLLLATGPEHERALYPNKCRFR